VCLHVCVCVLCVCVSVYMYVCVSVCVFLCGQMLYNEVGSCFAQNKTTWV